jgi:RNA polymerase sigma-70 factor (ECF subfamily)
MMTERYTDPYASLEMAELVTAAQQGDRSAMDELYARFHKHVLAVAFKRLGNWDEAQELCQDVFVQAFRKLDQLQVVDAFPGWLRQIVVRMAINRTARRGRLSCIDHEILEATVACHVEPSHEAIRVEEQHHVRMGLDRLGELDRETLVAFYLDGQSLIEMSRRFEAPVGTIKRRLHTARKRLAKECDFLVPV